MSNTHLLPDTMHEVMAREGDLLPACVLSETWPSTSGSMVLAPFATYGYVRHGTPTRLVYVDQPAVGITMTGTTGNYWLAIHADTHSAVSGWTRVPGTHYLWSTQPTQPVDPPGGLVFVRCTGSGGAVIGIDAGLAAYPRNRVAYGGATGALAYDPEFTYDATLNRAQTHQFTAPNVPSGNDIVSFYSALAAAGGTNRWAIFTSSDAPSAFNGPLHWSNYATGLSLRLGDTTAPGYTLDVNGTAILRGSTGIGVPPALGTYALNCGSANFTSVVTPSLSATTGTITTLTAGETGLGNTLIQGTLSATAATFTTLTAGATGLGNTTITGNLSVTNLANVYCAAQPGYHFSAQEIYSATSIYAATVVDALAVNVRGTSGGYSVYSPSAGYWHIGGLVGISYVPDPSYFLRVPSIYTDSILATTAVKPGGGPWGDSSSRTMKRHIQRIPNALPLLLEQRGCMYEWQEETRAALLPGTRYGLVAEEVTLPQWRYEQEDGTVAIAANGFEALTIEALREIVTRLEALEHARSD